MQFQPNRRKSNEQPFNHQSSIIMVLVLVGATAYLLLKGDGDIDMGGEKHGAEAAHMEEAKKDAPAAPDAKK